MKPPLCVALKTNDYYNLNYSKFIWMQYYVYVYFINKNNVKWYLINCVKGDFQSGHELILNNKYILFYELRITIYHKKLAQITCALLCCTSLNSA